MHAVGASGEASSSTSLNTVTLTTLEVAVSSNAMSATELAATLQTKLCAEREDLNSRCEVHLLQG